MSNRETIRQPFSNIAIVITVVIVTMCLGIIIWLRFRSSGTFISGWFTFLTLFFILLVWIGMPKKIVISDERVLLLGILRLISINKEDILYVSKLDTSLYPVFATCGFMGYAGIYYKKDERCLVEMFARDRNNLVFLKCKTGRSYVIGVDDTSRFLDIATEFGIIVK